MKQVQFHKKAGLQVRDLATEITEYSQDLQQVRQDIEVPEETLPSDDVLRLFELADGRIAVVRETEAGLVQEAPSPREEGFFKALKAKSAILVAAEKHRQDAEIVDNPFPSEESTSNSK